MAGFQVTTEGEVNMKVRALGEPLPDDCGFESGVVVHDEVYIQPC
jgi:hypothetical protein